jgi:hypothetical protein
MLKHPNYTFFVPDKRLYTLFKGITVTPCFVQASSMSLHGRAPFTRGTSSLSFVRRPLHIWRAYVLQCFSVKTRATTRAAPSAPKRSTTPPQPWCASNASHMTRSCPSPERSRSKWFLSHPHLRR